MWHSGIGGMTGTRKEVLVPTYVFHICSSSFIIYFSFYTHKYLHYNILFQVLHNFKARSVGLYWWQWHLCNNCDNNSAWRTLHKQDEVPLSKCSSLTESKGVKTWIELVLEKCVILSYILICLGWEENV